MIKAPVRVLMGTHPISSFNRLIHGVFLGVLVLPSAEADGRDLSPSVQRCSSS